MIYVYFARVGDYIKVGSSENPQRRVANLFKSGTRYCRPDDCPLDANQRELLLAIPGSLNLEWTCHAALDDYRAVGEFFIDEPGVREFIAEAAAGRFPKAARPGGRYAQDYNEQRNLTPDMQETLTRAMNAVFDTVRRLDAEKAASLAGGAA